MSCCSSGGAPAAAAVLDLPPAAPKASASADHAESFFRRPLPCPPAVDFSSAEGRTLFAEALADGTALTFFSLMGQFRTQDEPAYCSLGTLVMVLNALAIDPGRTWKGPWRWWEESMLECCEPLEVIRAQGVIFSKAVCIARCNGAAVEPYHAESPTSSLESFRDHVRMACSSEDTKLVCSYHRGAFEQTGGGHFSPIGAYHAASDSLLILDVARFKYPPHWVPVPLMWEAMQRVDSASGRVRGFMLIRRGGQAARASYVFTLAGKVTAERELLLQKLRANLCACEAPADGLGAARSVADVMRVLVTDSQAETLVTTYAEQFGLGCGEDGACLADRLLAEVGALSLMAQVPGGDRHAGLLLLSLPDSAWELVPEPVRGELQALVAEDQLSEGLQAEVRVLKAQLEALVACLCP